jgi:hypothetical protein
LAVVPVADCLLAPCITGHFPAGLLVESVICISVDM